MGNFLDSPKTEKLSDSIKTNSGLEIGATGMQGWRLEMEDEHILEDMPSLPDHTFVAVFDGHGGAGSAMFAKKHFVSHIEATDSWKKYKDSLDVKDLGEALIQAFLDMDEDLRVHQEDSGGQDYSGCTSVTAMITPTLIVCANAGDSRCILATDNSVKYLSVDHKPYDFNEKMRIVNAGGTVEHDRVDGELAVSRALGDFQWKARPDLRPQEQRVTCYPDLMTHERTGADEVLLLACDGVWDVFSNEEAAGLTYELLESGETSMTMIAEEIADSALDRGSRDNISVVAVRLPGARVGNPEYGGVNARRAERIRAQYAYYNVQPSSSPVSQTYPGYPDGYPDDE